MTEEIQSYIAGIKNVCPDLNDEALLTFSKGLTITKLSKNDIYIRSGEIQKLGAFVAKGLIRAFFSDEMGAERNIYIVPEGDYAFHYVSFIKQRPCPLTFQCLEHVVLINFSQDHLRNAYNQIPGFERYGRLVVERKFAEQQERLEGMLYKTAEERYIDFVEQYPQLFHRLSISQLCSYLGVERQTLTRIRQKLAHNNFDTFVSGKN